MPTDKVGPTYQRQREGIRERGFTRFGLSLNLTDGSYPQRQRLTYTAPKQIANRRSAEFKSQRNRPFCLHMLGSCTPHYSFLYGSQTPDLFKLKLNLLTPLVVEPSH